MSSGGFGIQINDTPRSEFTVNSETDNTAHTNNNNNNTKNNNNNVKY